MMVVTRGSLRLALRGLTLEILLDCAEVLLRCR
jgi:hypothetical protein